MKSKIFGKKQLVLAGMIAVLGGAVYLNYYVAANTPFATQTTSTTDSETSQTTRVLGESRFVNTAVSQTENYFDAARRTREEARGEALDIINETLGDVKADTVDKEAATAVAAAVAKAVEQEDAVESLIKAKGFADCVVYIENNYCHVAVQDEALDEAEALQITQIITTQSDVSAENISITAIAP